LVELLDLVDLTAEVPDQFRFHPELVTDPVADAVEPVELMLPAAVVDRSVP
jgi:hypothetical protein